MKQEFLSSWPFDRGMHLDSGQYNAAEWCMLPPDLGHKKKKKTKQKHSHWSFHSIHKYWVCYIPETNMMFYFCYISKNKTPHNLSVLLTPGWIQTVKCRSVLYYSWGWEGQILDPCKIALEEPFCPYWLWVKWFLYVKPWKCWNCLNFGFFIIALAYSLYFSVEK